MPDKEEKKIRMVLVGYGGMGKQYAGMMADGGIEGLTSVSYTHLDVYKRQRESR